MSSRYCPKCGFLVEEGDDFCAGCGSRLRVGAAENMAAGGAAARSAMARGMAAKGTAARGVKESQKAKNSSNLIIGIVVIALIAAVAAWYLMGRNSIVGSWYLVEEGATGTFTFEKNGHGSIQANFGGETLTIAFTYEAKDGNLALTINDNGVSESQNISYELKGKQMIWIDPNSGEELILDRAS